MRSTCELPSRREWPTIVSKELQEANAAMDIIRKDVVLHNSRAGRQGISERTASRGLTRLGYLGGTRKAQ